MLRITTATNGEGNFTIRVTGRLMKDGCEAIDQIRKDAHNRTRQVAIDLAGIQLVDRPAVEYLAHLRRRKVLLINLPPYVSLWVDQVVKERGSGNQSNRRRHP